MWAQIQRYLPEFDSAVLTGLDETRRPYSLRCSVRLADRALALTLSPHMPLQAGPASLLFHKHDERLWNLKSFLLRGPLVERKDDWRFRPETFVPGVGIGGLLSYVRFLVSGRRTTTRYLRQRGLARPQVAWDEFQLVFDTVGQEQDS